jgi:Amt family ammonium transporter
MVGGVIGILLTGVFATLLVNASGAAGGLTQLGRQALLDLVALAVPFVGTLLLLKLTDRLVGVRVSPEDEIAGLDLSQHGEIAYPSNVES